MMPLEKQVQVWITSVVLLSTATGCVKKPYRIAQSHFDLAESAYRTNTIREAEMAMVGYLQTLTEDEGRARGGVDYDMSRAITHERLFLIYRKLGDTNREGIEFQQSLEWL